MAWDRMSRGTVAEAGRRAHRSFSGSGPPMRHLRDFRGATLRWLPVKGERRAYALHVDGAIVGSLRWPKPFSYRAGAECADGRWAFAAQGVFQRSVVAMPVGSDIVVAQLTPRFFCRGTLAVAAGRAYDWRSEDIWGWKWRFEDESGRTIVRIERTGFFTLKADVGVNWDSMWQEDIPLLVHFAWYLLVMTAHRRRAAG